jgi:DNA invertase Pin-like site-specific DNA recombinase
MSGTRAAILARVSTAEQYQDNKVSIPDQIEACRAEIRRRGWVEHDVYPDVCSGATLDRPELGKILAEAAAGRIQVVVATRVDRVARDLLDLLILERDLREHGIALVLTEFPVDTTTDLGRFSLQQMGAAAELERSMIRSRTLAGRRGSVDRGGWPGGDPPYGFQVEHTIIGRHTDKRLAHNPAEVQVIERMVEMLLAEALPEGQTLTRIADWLNAHGYPPRKAARWTSQMVRWTLTRRTLIGELVYAKPQGGATSAGSVRGAAARTTPAASTVRPSSWKSRPSSIRRRSGSSRTCWPRRGCTAAPMTRCTCCPAGSRCPAGAWRTAGTARTATGACTAAPGCDAARATVTNSTPTRSRPPSGRPSPPRSATLTA